MATTPAHAAEPDGAFITSGGDHYRIIGGAALEVLDCAPLGGCAGAVPGDPADYRETPVDGTYVRVAETGNVKRAAGGTLFSIGTCVPLAGCPGAIDLDAGGYGAFADAHPHVANGTWVRHVDGPNPGLLFEAAGSFLVVRHFCMDRAQCPQSIDIDQAAYWDYVSRHRTIEPGAFVRVQTAAGGEEITRMAGGKLVPLSDCSLLGGCTPSVTMQHTLAQFYGYGAHYTVAEGTVLRGLPSGKVYRVSGGEPVLAPGAAGAIDVNDSTIASLMKPPPPPEPPFDPPPPPGDNRQPETEQPKPDIPLPRLSAPVSASFKTAGTRTRVTALTIRNLPAGTRVTLRCSKGCKAKTVSVAKTTPNLSLLTQLRGARLAKNANLEVTITKPGTIGQVIRWTMRAGKKPTRTTLCLAPDARSASACQ